MRSVTTENMLGWTVLACACLLLLAPLTPRTSWVGGAAPGLDGPMTETHSAGWESIAFVGGVVAIVGILAAVRPRPAGAPVAAGLLAAVGGLAVAALAAGLHWRDATSGTLAMAGYVTHPAPAAPAIAVVGTVGTVVAGVLLVRWVRQD